MVANSVLRKCRVWVQTQIFCPLSLMRLLACYLGLNTGMLENIGRVSQVAINQSLDYYHQQNNMEMESFKTYLGYFNIDNYAALGLQFKTQFFTTLIIFFVSFMNAVPKSTSSLKTVSLACAYRRRSSCNALKHSRLNACISKTVQNGDILRLQGSNRKKIVVVTWRSPVPGRIL